MSAHHDRLCHQCVSDFEGVLRRRLIVCREYRSGISHSLRKDLVTLGVMEFGDKGERKNMKRGTTVGFMAAFTAVLLATIASTSANHVATGKGPYAVAPQV